MAVITPDWLTKRGGRLRQNYDGAWVVVFDEQPQYLLRPVPAAGKYGCEVEQTINNKRLDSKETYPTADEALRGGLEELRKALGW
jgi:hypothetical protein